MSSWEPSPLHRHLSTIGVGPVFVSPPPHPLPPPPSRCCQDDVSPGDPCAPPPPPRPRRDGETITTWEIVGDIKSSPEEFVVREVGWAPGRGNDDEHDGSGGRLESVDINRNANGYYGRRPGWSRRIAGLDRPDLEDMVPRNDLDRVDEGRSVAVPRNDLDRAVEDRSVDEIARVDESHGQNYDAEDRELSSVTKKAKLSPEAGLALGKSPSSTDPSLSKLRSPPTSLQHRPHSDAPPQDDKDLNGPVDPNPVEGLRRILSRLQRHNGQNSDDARGDCAPVDVMLKRLSDLQLSALEEIDAASCPAADAGGDNADAPRRAFEGDAVWMPTTGIHRSQSSLRAGEAGDRRLLHSYVRRAFPLLRTESLPCGPPEDESNCGGGVKTGNDAGDSLEAARCSGNGGILDRTAKPWVRAHVDRTFFPLAPYLFDPRGDLTLLYVFRNRGPVPAPDGGVSRYVTKRCRGRRKGKRQWSGDQAYHKGDDAPLLDEVFVRLRLRPGLPRGERRVVHRILASGRRRSFETSTEHGVLLDYANIHTGRTSAVVVRWSFNAVRASCNRRRRADLSGDAGDKKTPKVSTINATFCVLHKRGCEHQVAVQSLSRALRCRAGDVGLAGIKDARAITHQFCTLRGIDIQRARRANASFGERVHLSNFVEVRDFLLDRGRLLGNHFDITLRNLRRMQRSYVEEGGLWKERPVPVSLSHLDAMARRVKDFGFVNFYGEQRCGDPGFTSHVGVRPFDVGRAMLRRDFSGAIDLIMAGRSDRVHSPGAEEANAREVWRTSGGDARATLRAFPRNANLMVRERDLMKGLLRYGAALEALKCVPHNVRMFWIHGYQSYIWNRVATKRIAQYGLHPVVGDLYVREHGGFGDSRDGAAADVRVVEEPGAVDIFQIVLPLPGYSMQYPQNEIGDLYKEMLQEDGIELSIKGRIPEATAKGSYRKLLQRANGLKWEVVNELKGQPTDVLEDQGVNAVRFTFELESGCYATMMLRELMVTTMARDCKAKK